MKSAGFRKDVGERKRVEIAPPGCESFAVTFTIPSVVDLAQLAIDVGRYGEMEAAARLAARVLATWTLSPEPPEAFEARLALLRKLEPLAAFTMLVNTVVASADESRKN